MSDFRRLTSVLDYETRSYHTEGASMVTIYGIKSCDTMKKARAWLADHGV